MQENLNRISFTELHRRILRVVLQQQQQTDFFCFRKCLEPPFILTVLLVTSSWTPQLHNGIHYFIIAWEVHFSSFFSAVSAVCVTNCPLLLRYQPFQKISIGYRRQHALEYLITVHIFSNMYGKIKKSHSIHMLSIQIDAKSLELVISSLG